MTGVMHLRRLAAIACLLLIPFAETGCAGMRPVRIGFIAELTGKQSELGINLRNGVQLAAEEINSASGINGRPVELVIEDDLGKPEGAKNAENKIIDSGVVAVIGHLTSNQTVEGYQVTQARGVVLLSGTASTSVLSGKKDLFFRTVPTSEYFGKVFAQYIRQQKGISIIAIILDADNNTYSEPMMTSFAEAFTSLGGQVTTTLTFSGASSPDFSPLVEQMQASGPESVYIIASPLNTANIAQIIRLRGWQIPLFAAPWAQGQDLIKNGGKAVEGLETIISYDMNSSAPALQAVQEKYEARYAQKPSFTAMFGYELMMMMAEALKKTGGSADGLPDALLSLKEFQGLEGTIEMDEYGDAMRQLFIQRLQDGQFETVDSIHPAP